MQTRKPKHFSLLGANALVRDAPYANAESWGMSKGTLGRAKHDLGLRDSKPAHYSAVEASRDLHSPESVLKQTLTWCELYRTWSKTLLAGFVALADFWSKHVGGMRV